MLSQPSWAAWIEISTSGTPSLSLSSRPSWAAWIEILRLLSKPLPAWIEMLTNLTTANVDGSRSPLGLCELYSGIMLDDDEEFHEINKILAGIYNYTYRRMPRE